MANAEKNICINRYPGALHFSRRKLITLILRPLATMMGLIPRYLWPIEQVKYAITRVNGTFWVKINGNYPVYIQNQSVFNGYLPMVYPMTPGTTNIHVTLADRELS